MGIVAFILLIIGCFANFPAWLMWVLGVVTVWRFINALFYIFS